MISEKEIKNLLKQLIKIKSVSGGEGEILKFLSSVLSDLGYKIKKQLVDEKSKERYNLLCGEGEVGICAHVDTVPELGMKKAFSPYEKNGLIYGRGSSDNKGSIAGLILSLHHYKKITKKLPKVFIAFTVDEEEWTAYGAKKLIEYLSGIKEMIVLEPTDLKICTEQEGSFEFELEVETNLSAHASFFEKYHNPIKILFHIIEKIEKDLRRKSNLLEINGGWRYYAVPKNAKSLIEIKMKKGEKKKDIENKIKKLIVEESKRLEKTKIEFKVIDSEEYIVFKKGNLIKRLKKSFEKEGLSPSLGIMSSWTEAAEFHKANIECVVFGPGNLEHSHTDKEHIKIREIKMFSKILLNLFMYNL